MKSLKDKMQAALQVFELFVLMTAVTESCISIVLSIGQRSMRSNCMHSLAPGRKKQQRSRRERVIERAELQTRKDTMVIE